MIVTDEGSWLTRQYNFGRGIIAHGIVRDRSGPRTNWHQISSACVGAPGFRAVLPHARGVQSLGDTCALMASRSARRDGGLGQALRGLSIGSGFSGIGL